MSGENVRDEDVGVRPVVSRRGDQLDHDRPCTRQQRVQAGALGLSDRMHRRFEQRGQRRQPRVGKYLAHGLPVTTGHHPGQRVDMG